MRAWQFTEVGVPLTLREIGEPEPGSGDIVIRVRAAGLCHSDVSFVDGTIAHLLAHTPITLGHEIVGTVAAVGADVSDFRIGDRVGVPADIDTPGTASDGGFADYVRVSSHQVARIPDPVSFDQAATASCAGRTAYHALVQVGQVRPGMRVGILGLGGLGMLGVQIAVAKGATVFGADINETLFDHARSLGASRVSTDICDFSAEGLDLVIDFVGFGGATTESALRAVRDRGRVVRVGLAGARGEIDLNDIVLRSLELVGSQGGTMQDYVETLELMAEGKLSSAIEQIAFEDIGEGLDRLERGGLSSRLVAVWD